jgi:hypothetical protein
MIPDTVREGFLARISTDATFRTLTGAAGYDDRLYAIDQADAVLSAAQPVYVTYMLLPMGETQRGVGEPTFSMVLWSRRGELVNETGMGYPAIAAVAARFHVLFDRKVWTIGTARVHSRIVRESDIEDTPHGFVGRMMQVRVGYYDGTPPS